MVKTTRRYRLSPEIATIQIRVKTGPAPAEIIFGEFTETSADIPYSIPCGGHCGGTFPLADILEYMVRERETCFWNFSYCQEELPELKRRCSGACDVRVAVTYKA